MKKLTVLFIILNFYACSLSIPNEVLVEYEKIERKVDFNFDVQPILSDRCYHCHGPDEKVEKLD